MKVSYLAVKCIGSVIVIIAFAGLSFAQKYNKCLPADIKEDTVVSYVTTTSTKGVASIQPITVSQSLAKLKARCVCDKLVDRRGKEIRFFHLQGCWGNPPADYLEILDNQRREIARLRKSYRVIELTCDTGVPRQSIS